MNQELATILNNFSGQLQEFTKKNVLHKETNQEYANARNSTYFSDLSINLNQVAQNNPEDLIALASQYDIDVDNSGLVSFASFYSVLALQQDLSKMVNGIREYADKLEDEVLSLLPFKDSIPSNTLGEIGINYEYLFRYSQNYLEDVILSPGFDALDKNMKEYRKNLFSDASTSELISFAIQQEKIPADTSILPGNVVIHDHFAMCNFEILDELRIISEQFKIGNRPIALNFPGRKQYSDIEIKIMCLLFESLPFSQSEMAEILGTNQSTISRHLKQLKKIFYYRKFMNQITDFLENSDHEFKFTLSGIGHENACTSDIQLSLGNSDICIEFIEDFGKSTVVKKPYFGIQQRTPYDEHYFENPCAYSAHLAVVYRDSFVYENPLDLEKAFYIFQESTQEPFSISELHLLDVFKQEKK